MGVSQAIRDYCENARKVQRSFNNPLKKNEHTDLKDLLEREFYDEEAKRFLADLPDDEFLYSPDEEMPISHRYLYAQLGELENKCVLDICCGLGKTSVKLAKRGARVSSIDISPRMIDLTRLNAERNGVAGQVDAQIMSVQRMKFADATFDCVVGLCALHHLNIESAGSEIARVLKPGGMAFFLEPRIPFRPLIFLRSLFPIKCFESPGGSQMTDRDVDRFSRYFSRCESSYFLFLRKWARLPLINSMSDFLDQADWYIINRCKFMRKLYWATVIQCTR